MPTTVKPKLTVAGAVQHAALVLNLDDTKRLGIALAEAAAQEAERNGAFAALVRELYAVLQPQAPKPKPAQRPELVPIKRIEGRELDAAGKLDPYFLHEVYGAHQLRTALERYPLAKLKEGADLVEARNRGAKANRRSKETVIDFIVRHVAP